MHRKIRRSYLPPLLGALGIATNFYGQKYAKNAASPGFSASAGGDM
jgi:hypothetical protein